jgi:hypothetical protein
MAAQIELNEAKLEVQVEGADRLWALRSHLSIPLEHVIGAERATDEAEKWLHGIRVGGTHVPGVISAGTFHSHGEWVFWDVHHPENAIAIQLRDERFARLVIEVDDPDGAVGAIRDATTGAGSS